MSRTMRRLYRLRFHPLVKEREQLLDAYMIERLFNEYGLLWTAIKLKTNVNELWGIMATCTPDDAPDVDRSYQYSDLLKLYRDSFPFGENPTPQELMYENEVLNNE